MTPQEALDRIATRCDEAEDSGKRVTDMGVLDALISDVRAILAEVEPEQPVRILRTISLVNGITEERIDLGEGDAQWPR